MQTIEELIASAPVFAGLEREQLELIAGCGRNEHADSGAFLLREGEPAARFFLIRRGTVALEVHAPGPDLDDRDAPRRGPRGLVVAVAPYRWQLDARALEPCELIGFDGVCLRGKCEADHDLGYELMRWFAENLVDRLQADAAPAA